MKKFFLMLFMAAMPLFIQAQEAASTENGDQHIVYKTIPKNMRIKDRVIVQNKSSYHILQAVVAVVGFGNEFHPLGSVVNLAPGSSAEVASFDNNKLRMLRNRTIAVKTKGTKGNNPANVDPSDITYDFGVNLSEFRHDLVIDIYSETGRGVMDF